MASVNLRSCLPFLWPFSSLANPPISDLSALQVTPSTNVFCPWLPSEFRSPDISLSAGHFHERALPLPKPYYALYGLSPLSPKPAPSLDGSVSAIRMVLFFSFPLSLIDQPKPKSVHFAHPSHSLWSHIHPLPSVLCPSRLYYCNHFLISSLSSFLFYFRPTPSSEVVSIFSKRSCG